MSDDNPYQSPQHYGPAEDSAPVAGAGEGLWRQGNLLVIREDAVLPDRCLKSNQPANGRRVEKTYCSHHPLVYVGGVAVLLVAFLVRSLPLLLIALLLWVIFRHTAGVQIPLSPQPYARRQRWIYTSRALVLVAFGMVVAEFVLPILGWFLPGPAEIREPLMVLSPVGVFLVAAIIHWLDPGLPSVRRIGEGHIWLKGVHPDFLAELPEWPGA